MAAKRVMLAAPHQALLGITLLLAALCTPSSSQPDLHPQQQLQDPRKLHAAYWLKVGCDWLQILLRPPGNREAPTCDCAAVENPGFLLKLPCLNDACFSSQAAARHIDAEHSPAANAACLKHYGQQYLERWRSLQGAYCNSSSAVLQGSHVQCWAHPEADLSTCYVQDLLLTSTSSFLGRHPHSSQLPQPAAGSIQLACNRTADPKSFLRGRLQSNEGSRAWLVTAPTFKAPSNTDLKGPCAGMHVVAHPVLFLLRVDPQNAFHDLETVVSVFSALAVLHLDPSLLRYGMEVRDELVFVSCALCRPQP
jgi:hypothetical protein